MITFSLAAPEPWGTHLRTAAASWPPSVCIGEAAQRTSNRGPTVGASLRDPAERITLHGGSAPGSARALISSRAPLAPSRLGAWVRRCVTRLPAGAGLAWPTEDEAIVIELPSDPSAVRTTRREVTTMFDGSPRLDDILLAASELAANAVQHGSGPTSLVISTGAGGAVIEIGDRAVTATPVVLPLMSTRSSGRGMAIVDVVTDCWGVTVLAAEKIVWCEFFDAGVTRSSSRRRP